MNPKLTRFSLFVFVAITALSIYLSGKHPAYGYHSFYFGIGAFYGAATGWVWVASLAKHRLLRNAIKVAIVGVFAWLMAEVINPQEVWIRYATQLGGMVVTQSVLFHLFKSPNWQIRDETTETSENRVQITTRSQFDIGDILLVTTAYGVLMALAIHYRQGAGAREYWGVAIGLWIFFPLLATIASHSGQFQSRFYSLIRMGVLFVLAIGGSVALALLQFTFADPVTLDQRWLSDFATAYTLLTLGYVVSVAVFAFMGTLGRLSRAQ